VCAWWLIAPYGAAYKATPCVLSELAPNCSFMATNPTATNINKGLRLPCHPDFALREVARACADVGIAHDGDADRVFLCDEDRALIDVTTSWSITALDMLAKDTSVQTKPLSRR